MSFFSRLNNIIPSIFQSHGQGPVTSTGNVGWSGGLFNILNFPKSNLVNFSNTQLDAQTAFEVSVFFACVSKISKDLAKLKINIKKRDPNTGAITLAPSHQLNRILNKRPTLFSLQTSFTFVETLFGWALRYQAGYAHIERHAAALPISLDLIHPSRVTLKTNPRTKQIEYVVTHAQAGQAANHLNTTVIQERNMLIIHGLGDGKTGFPITNMAREALGIAKSAQRFQATFFGNGLKVDAVLKTPKTLDPQAKALMKQEWKEKYSGNNSNELAILDNDLEYFALDMKSQDAQLLETRKFQVVEICRYFDMQLHKVQEMAGAKFNNIESQNREYADETLSPWAIRLQDEIQVKLLPDRSPFFAEFDFWPLLKGDLKTQGEFFAKALGGGANPGYMTINEVRELAPAGMLNPIPSGDFLTMPKNVAPLDLTLKGAKLDNDKKEKDLSKADEPPPPPPVAPVAPAAPVEEDEEQSSKHLDFQSYIPILEQTIEKKIDKESKFYERYKDRPSEEYLIRCNKFYETHLQQMADDIQPHCDFLGVEINLQVLCAKVCRLNKEGPWQDVYKQTIINAIAESARIPEVQDSPLDQYPDGLYSGDHGELYVIKGGEMRPYETETG